MSSYAKFSQYIGNMPIRPPVLVSTIDTNLQSIVNQLPQNTNSGYQTLKNGYPKFPNTCRKVTRSLVSHQGNKRENYIPYPNPYSKPCSSYSTAPSPALPDGDSGLTCSGTDCPIYPTNKSPYKKGKATQTLPFPCLCPNFTTPPHT